MIALRHEPEDEQGTTGSRSSEEQALLPMLGEGWEAMGDGIYRFVGRSEESFAREPERAPESLVEDLAPQAEHVEPAEPKRKGKHKRFRVGR